MLDAADVGLVVITFLVAGGVKGVIGLGLPTVSLALPTVTLGLQPAWPCYLYLRLLISRPRGVGLFRYQRKKMPTSPGMPPG